MKYALIILTFFAGFIASCSDENESESRTINGRWYLDEALLLNVSYDIVGDAILDEPDFYTPILYDKGSCVWDFRENGDVRFHGNSSHTYSSIISFIIDSSSDNVIFYTLNETQLSFDIIRHTSNELVLKRKGVTISTVDGTEYSHPNSAITLFFSK